MHNNFYYKHISFYVVVAFLIFAIIGYFLPQHLYSSMDIANRMQGVSPQHILGTDYLGRDVFYRIIRGTYNVSLVAFPSVIFGVIVGGIPALLVSRKKTNLRYIVGGFMDVLFSFPIVLIALVMVARIGSSPIVATVSLGVFFVPVFYRIVYLSSLGIWQMDFVSSARLSNKSIFYIAIKHILPNIMPVIISASSIQFAMAILAESGLGYLGLSVKSPQPTWGSMILDAQNVIFVNPYFIIPIGCVITIFVCGFVSFGDYLKQAR